MRRPAALAIAVTWLALVLLALVTSSMYAAAGRMEGAWVGAGMAGGIGWAAVSAWAAWQLQERVPRLVLRLLVIAAMAGALWSVGTLTRVVFALVG